MVSSTMPRSPTPRRLFGPVSATAFAIMFLILACPVHTQGGSLYAHDEPVTQLARTNFTRTIHDSSTMWVVEFYVTWCGHCQRLVPVYVKLAREMLGWSSVVGVAAIACSDVTNTDLCRSYNIDGYPTVKFFPPHSSTTFRGDPYDGGKTVWELRHAVLEYLTVLATQGPSHITWPKLDYIRHLNELIQDTNTTQLYIVVDDDKSSKEYTALRVILDLMYLRPRTVVGRMSIDQARLLGATGPGVYTTTSFGTLVEIYRGSDQTAMVSAVTSMNDLYLTSTLLTTTTSIPWATTPRKYVPADGLHMQDLESSLYYSLWVEVASQSTLAGESLTALKKYIEVLARYHPGDDHVRQFLNATNQWLKHHNGTLTGQAWTSKITHLQSADAYIPQHIRWTGCNGSAPRFRGYPCSLWMTFHALTVNAFIKELTNVDFEPLEVLHAIRDYVRHFLGCRQCATHFGRGAERMDELVHVRRDVVLWLWRSHNRANSRLYGDHTEDPQHPKVQFPSVEACAKCRRHQTSTTADVASSDGRFTYDDTIWREDKVLAYLLRFYVGEHIIDDDLPYDFAAGKFQYTTWSADDDEAPTRRPITSSGAAHQCSVVVTEWTPCSRSCDVGTSFRLNNNNSDCQSRMEVRLCMHRPCSAKFPNWSRSQWHISNCPRQGHTYRLSQPQTLEFGNCTTVISDTWRVCGKCPTPSRGRQVCCHPARSNTQWMDVQCPGNPEKTRRGAVQVEVIEYCQCDEQCADIDST